MALAQRLAQHPGIYFGTGDGVESGPFVSRLEVAVLPNGGVAIDHEATSREQGVEHREHSLLVARPDGRDRLRSLKRRISDAVYRRLIADASR